MPDLIDAWTRGDRICFLERRAFQKNWSRGRIVDEAYHIGIKSGGEDGPLFELLIRIGDRHETVLLKRR